MNLAVTDPEPVVAVCATFADAQRAADALVRRGFDRACLSVVGNSDGLPPAASMEERLHKWSRRGGAWGAIGGLAAGAAMAVPSFGAAFATGPVLAVLLAALEGAALGGGFSAIAAALTSSGLPDADATVCEREISARRYLVLVHGTRADVARAGDLLAGMGLRRVPGDRAA